MAIIKPEQLSSGPYDISGSFSGSFSGDGSNLINVPTQSFETGSFVTTSSFNSFTASFESFTGSYNTGSFSGSFEGTSSYAVTASYLEGGITIDTGSFVTTSSFNSFTSSFESFTGSYNTGSFTGSFTGDGSGLTGVVSSSYAETASYIETAQTASYVLNAVSASYSLYAVSASYEINYETSSSYAETASVAISSSYAQTASYTPNYLPLTGGTISGTLHQSGTFYPDQIDWFSSSIGYDTGSYILTTTANGLTTYANYQDVANTLTPYISTVSSSTSASYADTASYVQNAQTASYVTTAQTASYVLNAVSSSFATSSSYALSASYAPSTVPSGPFGIANTSGVYTYYSTFSASMAAATSGQTVEMFADVTETTNISIALKDGVNINGNGHTYTLNQAGTSNCIQDGGVAVNCSISNITFKRLGGTPSSTNTLCMYITGASRIKAYSTILIGGATNMRCLTINNASAEVYGVYAEGYNPVATITNGIVYNSEFRSINGGGMTVEANGTAIKCVAYGYGADGLSSSGKIIDCVGYGALNNGISVSAGLVQNCTGYGGGGAGISMNGSAIVAINCTGYSVAGAGIFTSSPTSFDLKGYSTAGAGISIINGAVFDSLGYSTSTNGILATNAGANITELRSCKAISTTAIAINMNNPTSGCKIYNTEAYSKWNNAVGHGIVVAGANAEIVQCTIEVTNASANCISGSSALTTKYANNAFKGSTIAVNANITQGIVNTHDNQGNILV
jgi:hypothetical protein